MLLRNKEETKASGDHLEEGKSLEFSPKRSVGSLWASKGHHLCVLQGKGHVEGAVGSSKVGEKPEFRGGEKWGHPSVWQQKSLPVKLQERMPSNHLFSLPFLPLPKTKILGSGVRKVRVQLLGVSHTAAP